MRSSPVPATPESLLEHDAFLRSLARGLVGDASGADDVVQQAYVTALARARSLDGGALRAWLGGIVRRLAWHRHRSEERRARHERAVRPSDPVPSVAEVVAHEEARRRVVAAVLALDEPARSTMLLRYFRQMAPGAIARHLGVPVETVRTRIKRAQSLNSQ
jgi:RNA polymerase sigma-70 factor (ECF subfamily)